ncbi:MAG: hypothetical protein EX272_05765 [Chromatiales bacterium]|nr:MAG: hypothetical protein EX272_05765 [Chromatiales bacterium]
MTNLKFTNTILVCAITAFIAGCAASPQQKLDELLSLDEAHFRDAMTITDDSLETTVVFSTQGGWAEKHGVLGIVWSDSFLRGYIDKQTGHKTFQAYVAMRHTLGGWAHPYQANYGKPLRTTDVSKVSTDVDCSASDLYGSCKYEEHVVFTIHPDEVLRIWTEVTPEDFKTKVWKFRIKNQGTKDYDDGIPLPEMLALVNAMNEYSYVPMQ